MGKDEQIRALQEKVEMYEGFLHDLNLYAAIVMDGEKVSRLLDNACRWSYSHRCGNGELTDEEQLSGIRYHFERLRNLK